MFKATKSNKNTSMNYSAVVSFFFYVSVLILIQCPIFLVQQRKMNFYQVYFYVREIPAGADDLWATCRILMNGEF